MKAITLGDARKLFLAHPARFISQEQSEIYYDNFSGYLNVAPYLTCGCLAVKSGSCWHVHALACESDILSAIEQVKKKRKEESEKIMAFTWNNIPEELEECVGSYKFARNFRPYEDDAVRSLTMDDADAIEKCCASDSDDNYIGKGIAADFFQYRNYLCLPNNITLGLFSDKVLTGIAKATENNELGIATIDIFVNRLYRNKGYAKRLLSAICATSENLTYCYSCVKTNIASISTAKACGFEFKGAYIFV